MISVEEAVDRICGAFSLLGSESVPLERALGRVLAHNVLAACDQPPAAVSAMDGYAVRLADAGKAGAALNLIGEAPAGRPFPGRVGPDDAVRIFTGAVMPDGADAVLIQENAQRRGRQVVVETAASSKHVRPAGLDFRRGEILGRTGRRLGARDLALLAAGDAACVEARRKPRVALVSTGDELSRPGEPRKPGGIVASSLYGLCPLVAQWGGEPLDLGILPDDVDAIGALPVLAKGADLVVTLGGASVGDHDLVQRALEPRGFVLDFWKIAMRPGKPLIFGRLGSTPLIGLPGNPVSAFVCAHLFVKPAIAAMMGMPTAPALLGARTAGAMPANDSRQDYVRAHFEFRDGDLWATPFPLQDSSMLSALAAADGLIVRRPYAEAVAVGDTVAVLSFGDDSRAPDMGG